MIESFLLPVMIVVVLPITIVAIVNFVRYNRDNKRTEVLIKAIETNGSLDAAQLAEAMDKLSRPKKTPREKLNGRLMRGCIFSLIGVAFLIELAIESIFGLSTESGDISLTLSCGLIFLAVGISFLIVYFVTRKQIEA